MIQYLVVAVAALCIVLVYLKVSAMKGQPGGQLLRLLPILGYVAVSITVLFTPGLVLGSLLGLFLLHAADYALTLGDVYNAARKAIPPTTAELLRRLRFAPYVLGVLAILYVVTVRHHVQKAPKQKEQTVAIDSMTSVPNRQEVADEAEWENLKRQQP